METRIKSATGAALLLSGLPAMAQETAALKASAVNACASCPPTSGVVMPPGDPTMLIAGAFILGVVVGVVVARAFGNKKQ
ncbi:MAG: hypothetical protein ABL916_02545 [Burkholderiaceae bacterium]